MDQPNLIESVSPLSGRYSLKRDLRLNAWCFVAMAFYAANLLLLEKHPAWTPMAKGLLTLSPLIPGALYLRTCLRFIGGMDELQRRIQLEAWLFASLGALLAGAVINTLNEVGIGMGGFQHGLGLGATFALTFVLWAGATAVANRRFT